MHLARKAAEGKAAAGRGVDVRVLVPAEFACQLSALFAEDTAERTERIGGQTFPFSRSSQRFL